MIGGKRVGDIVFSPDLSADIFEKWVGFLAIVGAGIGLMLLTGVIAYSHRGFGTRPAAGAERRPDPDAAGPLRPSHPAVGAAGNPQELRGSQ